VFGQTKRYEFSIQERESMQRPLSIDVLRTFQAVARFRRFKRAALFLNKSASAVTAQIQKLEESTGKALFFRSNQMIELTKYGVDLLSMTKEFIASHDKLQAAVTSAQIEGGKLSLGLPDSYAAQCIEHGLASLIARHPLLEIEIEARSSGELLAMLAKHQIDAAVVVSAKEIEGSECLLVRSPVWMASKDFKMPNDASLPVALHLPGCPYRECSLNALKDHESKFRVVFQSANSRAVEACIRAGFAIGVGEAHQAPDLVYGERLPFALPPLPTFGVYLVARPDACALPGLGETLKRALQV
jgi:DNA-binding transcriptional LysR family regulator